MYDVCIIGAGLSGIISTLECQKADLKTITLEQNPDIGGCWSTTYPETRLQSHKDLYELPDFPYPKETELYPTSQEVLAYLDDIVQKTKIRRLIKLNSQVIQISPHQSGSRLSWTVTFKNKNNGHTTKIRSHYLIIATGLFNVPLIPKYKGIEKFKGTILHSKQVGNNYTPRYQRVVVIGNGPSGMDLATLSVDRKANDVSIIYRKPKWIIMRNLFNPSSYYNYYFLQILYLLHLYGIRKINMFIFHTAMAIMYIIHLYFKGPFQYPDKPISRSNLVINDSFLDYYNSGALNYLNHHIKEFQEDGLLLDNGTLQRADIIIMATGFDEVPNFLNHPMPLLYKYIIPINQNLENVFFIGYASTLANLPRLVTQQIRYVIDLIKGRSKITISEKDMSQDLLHQSYLSHKLGVPENDVTYNYFQYLKSLELPLPKK